MARVSYKKGKFLFFDGKLLQRQIVPATKHLDTKSSGRQNVDIKMLKIFVQKSNSPQNKEKL